MMPAGFADVFLGTWRAALSTFFGRMGAVPENGLHLPRFLGFRRLSLSGCFAMASGRDHANHERRELVCQSARQRGDPRSARPFRRAKTASRVCPVAGRPDSACITVVHQTVTVRRQGMGGRLYSAFALARTSDGPGYELQPIRPCPGQRRSKLCPEGRSPAPSAVYRFFAAISRKARALAPAGC